ncbi:hypothetical protein [Allostreptomyces psammosilenae]|uniref:Bulb-type lectin domain-containing protein n=1 Tax=Allostreptomyces psammosilenae TaxID=1892865 RepID=A0A852ZZD3_9ACTN|nr:hypothetical protein [Allostreptomyces psammosilenae]NYI03951.1 hypothetical protein [Allostreptomyces psammosilenae]
MFKVHRSMAVAVAAVTLALGGMTAGGAQAAMVAQTEQSATVIQAAPEAQLRGDLILHAEDPANILEQNEAWVSPNGRASLIMQGDGNLVLYCDGEPVWQARDVWPNGYVAVFQSDGNFVVYDIDGNPIWASNTAGQGAYLAVQNDCNVVIYDRNGVPIWHTNTAS